MAVFAATDYNILLATVDRSSWLQSAILPLETDELETTTYGPGWRSFISGLKKGTLTFLFNQDFAAASVDAVLFPLFGTVVAFEIKPTSAAVGATNPRYTGNFLLSKYTPFAAKVGDLATIAITLPTTGAVQRLTA